MEGEPSCGLKFPAETQRRGGISNEERGTVEQSKSTVDLCAKAAHIRFMVFECDPEKEKRIFAKHGVDFSTVPVAFNDPNRVLRSNRGRSSSEPRFQCIGYDGRKILTFTFTLRAGAVRVINAGYWRKGKTLYESKNA
jgi:uncharacterized protein